MRVAKAETQVKNYILVGFSPERRGTSASTPPLGRVEWGLNKLRDCIRHNGRS